MAKRRSRGDGPSKSQLIRDYMEANPKDGPQAVAAALKSSHGLTVTPQFVSTVKSNANRKRKGRRGRKPGGAAPASTAASGKLSMEVLMAAKAFAQKLGGVGKAKAAVDSLAKLLD